MMRGTTNGMQRACVWAAAVVCAAGMGMGWEGVARGAGTFGEYRVLHAFNLLDGCRPTSGVVTDGEALYGSTWGDPNLTYGGYAKSTVFRLGLDGSGFSVLHTFAGGSGDGAYAYGGVAVGGGTVYGTTTYGGAGGSGTVYQVGTDGTGYEVITSFGSAMTEARSSWGSPALVGSTLYGTTQYGGSTGASGTVFQVSGDGTGFGVVRQLGVAPAGGTAVHPTSGVVVHDGVLYGTTEGSGNGNDWGAVYRMNLDGTGYAVVHQFVWGEDGMKPEGALVRVGTTLYGTTEGGGGTGHYGTVYAIEEDGSDYRILYRFGEGAGGSNPRCTLAADGGWLYGTTLYGGNAGGYGTLFRMGLDGSGFQLLHSFDGSNGGGPQGVVTVEGGMAYGTTFSGGSGGGTVWAVVVPEPGALGWMAGAMVAAMRRKRRGDRARALGPRGSKVGGSESSPGPCR